MVRMHNRLHAKVGIIGDNFSFVGSSNMSTNGLGFEGGHAAKWEEANVVFEGIEASVQDRFNELWGQSSEISSDDLKLAEKNWRIRRVLATEQAAQKSGPKKSLWDAIVGQSDDLRSLPCYVAYYYEMTEKEKATFNEAVKSIKVEFGKNRSAYQDWPELPEAYLIGACRSRRSENTIKDIEYSRRPPNAPVYEGHGSEFLVVESLKSLPLFSKLSGNDLMQFKSLILRYVAGKKKPKKSRVISIQDLVDFYHGEPKP
ncbi:hypothetical protein [Loktanella salsilacus]|uniref:hypothetical protein n=1 Tax=Loktanella salsilacus TaxID=195913 RepID=UPI0030F87FA5